MSAVVGKVVFACPVCNHKMSKRTSWMEHQFLRRDVYCCSNPICNASFTGHTELTHIASPSGMENGGVCSLPPSPSYLRNAALAAHIRELTAANGDLFADLPARQV